MVTVRRWYIFLICIISLQSVTWALIRLLQGTFLGEHAPLATAFQIAVIVIGLPVFLGHWLWAQYLAGREADERGSVLRRLYLYAMLALFLAPFADALYDLIASLLALAIGEPRELGPFSGRSAADAVVRDLSALVVLALLWFYHWRIVRSDARDQPETGGAATIRRLYILGFSAAGMIGMIYAIIDLLRWTMVQFSIGTVVGENGSRLIDLTDAAARLFVCLPLWLIFWHWAQRLFAGMGAEEHESALRKFYLYATVFVVVLGVVTNATLLLTGFFRSMLGLVPQGELRDVLPGVIVLGAVWAYHAVVLRSDTLRVQEAPRQAGLRRLYRYLVAVVGLVAFLVGLSGDSSVLIRLLAEQSFGDTLREQLAWCTAALLIGLPVWLWPWREMQRHALLAGAIGVDERRSGVRKVYLYFFLFVATLTVLAGLIYIVYRLVSLLLGEHEGGNVVSDIAQSTAFALIAAVVWIYHSLILRTDGQLNDREQAQRLADFRVAVVDGEMGHFGGAVLEGLQRELPGLVLIPIGLTPAAVQVMGHAAETSLAQQLADARVIVGPWNMLLGNGMPDLVTAVLSSPARKLLIPVRNEDCDWVGVERWNVEDGVRQTIHAVKQIVAGEDVKPIRPMNVGTLIGMVIGVVFFLILLAIPLLYFLTRF